MALWTLRRTKAVQVAWEELPLGDSGLSVPWHMTAAEVRRLLGEHAALGMEVDGSPSARLRWPDRTLRATLEFVDGVAVGGCWFATVPGARIVQGGQTLESASRLRAAQVPFPDRDPRANWKWVLSHLGKPTERQADGAWGWIGQRGTVRYWETAPGEAVAAFLRLAARTGTRPIEIVNQSALPLYRDLALRLDFGDAAWESLGGNGVMGVPVRVFWDAPRDRAVRLEAHHADRSVSIEVPQSVRRVVLANDARGGVRIVV